MAKEQQVHLRLDDDQKEMLDRQAFEEGRRITGTPFNRTSYIIYLLYKEEGRIEG